MSRTHIYVVEFALHAIHRNNFFSFSDTGTDYSLILDGELLEGGLNALYSHRQYSTNSFALNGVYHLWRSANAELTLASKVPAICNNTVYTCSSRNGVYKTTTLLFVSLFPNELTMLCVCSVEESREWESYTGG